MKQISIHLYIRILILYTNIDYMGRVIARWGLNSQKTEWKIKCGKEWWNDDLPQFITKRHPNFGHSYHVNKNGTQMNVLFVNKKQCMANGDIIDGDRIYDFYGNVGCYDLENRYYCSGLLLLNNIDNSNTGNSNDDFLGDLNFDEIMRNDDNSDGDISSDDGYIDTGDEITFKVEYARSGRSKCHGCESKIAPKGCLRIGYHVVPIIQGSYPSTTDFVCILGILLIMNTIRCVALMTRRDVLWEQLRNTIFFCLKGND